MIRLVAVLFTSLASARPYYVNESSLAAKLETQSEVVASSSNYSAPPPTSSWGAAVLDAIIGGDASNGALASAAAGDRAIASSDGGPAVMANSLRAALAAGQSPLDALELGVGTELLELSRTSGAALDLLVVSLESTGDGQPTLASIAAKGAIVKWNALVEAAVLQWGNLAQKRDASGGKELGTITTFLQSPKTGGIQNVLASFRTP